MDKNALFRINIFISQVNRLGTEVCIDTGLPQK